MITRREIDIIRSMLLQPHENKLLSIGITGKSKNTNFKITDYTHSLLQFYQKQYSQAHKEKKYKGKHSDKIGMSRFVHIMCKYFGQQEPAIFKDEKFDIQKYNSDLLYAIKCVKKVFNGYIPDVKIRTQSDALMCLVGWNLARLRENSDGISHKGFVDYNDDDGEINPKDGIDDYSKVKKSQLKELLHKPEPSGLDDLFEPLQPSAQYIELDKDFLRREK